jgi:hypothetical protein
LLAAKPQSKTVRFHPYAAFSEKKQFDAFSANTQGENLCFCQKEE